MDKDKCFSPVNPVFSVLIIVHLTILAANCRSYNSPTRLYRDSRAIFLFLFSNLPGGIFWSSLLLFSCTPPLVASWFCARLVFPLVSLSPAPPMEQSPCCYYRPYSPLQLQFPFSIQFRFLGFLFIDLPPPHPISHPFP